MAHFAPAVHVRGTGTLSVSLADCHCAGRGIYPSDDPDFPVVACLDRGDSSRCSADAMPVCREGFNNFCYAPGIIVACISDAEVRRISRPQDGHKLQICGENKLELSLGSRIASIAVVVVAIALVVGLVCLCARRCCRRKRSRHCSSPPPSLGDSKLQRPSNVAPQVTLSVIGGSALGDSFANRPAEPPRGEVTSFEVEKCSLADDVALGDSSIAANRGGSRTRRT